LKHVLTTQLGYGPQDEEMLTIAGRLAEDPRRWGPQYRFTAFHFPREQLSLTPFQVSLKGRDSRGQLLPISASVPPAEVRYRIELVRAGRTLLEALDAPFKQSPRPRRRELPLTRVTNKAIAEFQKLGLGDDRGGPDDAPSGAASKRQVDLIKTPTKAAGQQSTRSPAPKAQNVGVGRGAPIFANATRSTQKVLAREVGMMLARRKLVVTEQARADCESKLMLAEFRAFEEDAASRGLREQSEASHREAYAATLKRLVALEHENRELQANLRASELVLVALRRAARQPAKFTTWRSGMLDDPDQLGKVVRELTGFHTARVFRLAFNLVFDRQGCPAGPLGPGVTSRLDYYFSPKHNPSSKATSSGLRNGLNPKKPAGLDGPIEACFLTFVMLRCGLSADVVAILFGISAGAASQIFATWVPFISKSLQAWSPWPTREQVRATLPEKFREGPLARTTASARCRIIIDCTEVWVQTPADPAIRQLF
jgi:hypothetical protein